MKPTKIEKRKIKHKKEEATSSESEDEEDKEEKKGEKKMKKEETIEIKEKMSVEGNMIVLESDDSMWKSSAMTEKHDESKVREEEFEEYLEDLFF